MEPNQDDLGSRLAFAWASGQLAEAASILVDEVTPRCLKHLLSKFKGQLSHEDCEDCVECGIEKLMEHTNDTSKIRNPYSYVFTCAIHEAFDITRERSQVVHFDPEWLGEGKDDIDDAGEVPIHGNRTLDSALIIAEIALDAEVSESSSRKVIKEVLKLSVSRLANKRKRLIEVLLEHGAFIKNETLAELMGMKNGALRSLKSHAFNDISLLIPQAAQALGVDISNIIALEPEGMTTPPTELPSPDEDDEAIPPEEA